MARLLLLGLGLHGASGMVASMHDAFSSWGKSHHAEELMQKQINQLAHPDLKVWVTFEGVAQPAIIPGSGTTCALVEETARLHNLDRDQEFRFLLHGKYLVEMGIPVSESALSDFQDEDEDLSVNVQAMDWPVKRGYGSNPGLLTTARAATRHRRYHKQTATRQIKRPANPFGNSLSVQCGGMINGDSF